MRQHTHRCTMAAWLVTMLCTAAWAEQASAASEVPSCSADKCLKSPGQPRLFPAAARLKPASSRCRCAAAKQLNATSPFSSCIATQQITVTSPAAGEVYTVGDTINIRWTGAAATGVRLWLSPNNGFGLWGYNFARWEYAMGDSVRTKCSLVVGDSLRVIPDSSVRDT